MAEAYLRLVREAHAGRTPGRRPGWLYRVTANLVLSRGRRICRRPSVPRSPRRPAGRRVPEARHLRLEIDPALREALLALPADARIAVVMAARGATRREIAEAHRSQRGRDADPPHPRPAVRQRPARRTPLCAHRRGRPMTRCTRAPSTSPARRRPSGSPRRGARAHGPPSRMPGVARRAAGSVRPGRHRRGRPCGLPRLHDRIREVAVSAPRSGPRGLGIVLAFVLLAVGVVGASLGVGALVRPAAVAPSTGPRGRAGRRRQPGGRCRGAGRAAVRIEANGYVHRRTRGPDVQSDPASHPWTLETRGTSTARAADDPLLQRPTRPAGGSTSSGSTTGRPRGPGPDWGRSRPGRGPGPPWAPRSRATSTSWAPPQPVPCVRLEGLRIAVRPDDHVKEPMGGGTCSRERPGVDGDPFRAGGPLHCSGILQLPPQAAEPGCWPRLPAPWRWEYATGTKHRLLRGPRHGARDRAGSPTQA